MQYYAITQYGTSKAAPFALIRMNQGVFELHRSGNWEQTSRYDGILVGEFNDYDAISAEDADKILSKTT
jgi:hypothetical protein